MLLTAVIEDDQVVALLLEFGDFVERFEGVEAVCTDTVVVNPAELVLARGVYADLLSADLFDDTAARLLASHASAYAADTRTVDSCESVDEAVIATVENVVVCDSEHVYAERLISVHRLGIGIDCSTALYDPLIGPREGALEIEYSHVR